MGPFCRDVDRDGIRDLEDGYPLTPHVGLAPLLGPARTTRLPVTALSYNGEMLRISSAGLVLLLACAPSNGTYCQSGPKYGTQCYQNTGTGDLVPTYASPTAPESTPTPTTPSSPVR